MEAVNRIFQCRISHILTNTPPGFIPPEVKDALAVVISKALMIEVRLRDEEARRTVLVMVNYCRKVVDLPDRNNVEIEKERLVKSFVKLNVRIGKVLADLDTLDDEVG